MSEKFYCNWKIQEALKNLGITVIGKSDVSKGISSFNYGNSGALLSLLIENNMNRYIFNIFLRSGYLDVNNFPFDSSLFKEKSVQDILNESFIKKFECLGCNNVLFRSHIHEINYTKVFRLVCPLCDKLNEFEYDELKNDFKINRNDLIKFLDRLSEINILVKESRFYCPNCKNTKKLDKLNITCDYCKKDGEIKFYYDFKDDFLKNCLRLKNGDWFEWYVYLLNNHIYSDVEHNIMIRFETKGLVRECEIDVICLNDKNELLVFECKDNIFRETGFGEMENIPLLSSIFDKVFLVGSIKISDKSKQRISYSCSKDIIFIAGSELEIQYASPKILYERFLAEPYYKSIRLFNKISSIKKNEITFNLIDFIISSSAKNTNSLSALSNIFATEPIMFIADKYIDKLEKIASLCILNIQQKDLVIESINLLTHLLTHYRDNILKYENAEKILDMGADYLTQESLSGYSERRHFFSFYTLFLTVKNFASEKIEKNTIQNFFSKFIGMLDIYYSWNNRHNAIDIIDKYWPYFEQDTKNKLGIVCAKIFSTSASKGVGSTSYLLCKSIEKHYTEFDCGTRNILKDSLKEYVSKNAGSEYEILLLKKL